jgi:hypothetical protein
MRSRLLRGIEFTTTFYFVGLKSMSFYDYPPSRDSSLVQTYQPLRNTESEWESRPSNASENSVESFHLMLVLIL